MSFFSFLSSHKEEISIVFDVGSGTLGGALIRFHTSKAPEILYTYREPIISRKQAERESLTNAMLKTLENVSKDITHNGLPSIKAQGLETSSIHTIYYVFSSPWVLSQTKTLLIKKEEEVLVTREFIEDAVKKEEKVFEEMYKAEGKIAKEYEYDLKIIEKSVVGISLNGYPTEDPYMKKAHQIEIPFFISVTSGKLIEKMNDVVNKHIHFKSSVSHSCMLLSYLTLRDIYHAEKDFMLVDIHGELTDMAIIKNGTLAQTGSFPIGVNTVIRRIAETQKCAPQIAESYIKIFLDGKSDNKLSVAMKDILGKIKHEWMDSFHQAVDTLHKESRLPQTVFIIVGSGMEKFFSEFLQEEKFDILSMTSGSFNVVPLDAETFTKFSSYYKKAELDSFLTIHTLALNKLVEHNQKLL